MNPDTTPSPLEFDHLVVMLRDELDSRAPAYEAAGYRLAQRSVHNLGSVNRLMSLDSTFIELLGWPAGEPPRRREIADQPQGLDALVLRSRDAAADHARLLAAGFDVGPVLRLERRVDFHGQPRTARFDTLRFASQPLAGLRVYLCQHLTPELVWDPPLMAHPNGVRSLVRIRIAAPDAAAAAQTLATLANATAATQGGLHTVALPNVELMVQPETVKAPAGILGATLRLANGDQREFEVIQ